MSELIKLNSKIIIFILFISLFFIFNYKKSNIETPPLSITHIVVENCNPQKQACAVEFENVKLEILLDKNIYYLKPFNISVTSDLKKHSKIENIRIEFKMKNMDMGVNRFELKGRIGKNHSLWESKALLPICVTGRADWSAELEVVTEKSKYRLSFPFLVQKVTN